MTPTAHLYDYTTGERISVATAEQIAASTAAGEVGAILIDTRTGEVITPGSWIATNAATAGTARSVYVS
jgi:hypothetical protein